MTQKEVLESHLVDVFHLPKGGGWEKEIIKEVLEAIPGQEGREKDIRYLFQLFSGTKVLKKKKAVFTDMYTAGFPRLASYIIKAKINLFKKNEKGKKYRKEEVVYFYFGRNRSRLISVDPEKLLSSQFTDWDEIWKEVTERAVSR